jgi:ketosteroid isomerase-like protein
VISSKPSEGDCCIHQLFGFIGILLCLIIAKGTVAAETINPAHSSKAEQTLWNLEHAYWRYVQDNDLSAYSNLWHKDFLGWPSVSAAPVHKDHITEWITAQTSKGLVFKTGEFKAGAIQVTGDVAMVCYWITFKWLDKDGNGAAHTFRITHAWLKTGNDWRIIGGMSMPEPNTPRD